MNAQERIEEVGKSFPVPQGIKLDMVRTPVVEGAPLYFHYTFVSETLREPLASVEVSFRWTGLGSFRTDVFILTREMMARPSAISPYISANVAALNLANLFEKAIKE